MGSPRLEMDAALERMVDAELRPLGFVGSLPDLRRLTPARVELVAFVHDTGGDRFAVEVAACPPNGLATIWGKVVEPKQVRVSHVSSERLRLRPIVDRDAPSDVWSPPDDREWFVYAPRHGEPGAHAVHPEAHYDAIAAQIPRLLAAQAEPFWAAATPSATDGTIASARQPTER